MDWVILIFLGFGFLFFWGVWIFAYWLPMARESQRQFEAEQARERAAENARDEAVKHRPPEQDSAGDAR